VVPGSYEMIELMIVVTVAFALSYAGIHNAHVKVDLIVSKFNPTLQKVCLFITCLISLAFWGALAFVAYRIAMQKGMMEATDYFLIPYLPFRFVFGFGLFLLSIFFFVEMLTTFQKGSSK
jgi:TRAP-type C4-dicarboxylate transport system permease small subunit